MSLSPLNTDSNKFPLSGSPYYSRVSTHANDNKNYVMLAFNPGYALQAAELNEIQELFFLNQSLTQRLNANWNKFNSGQLSPFTSPFWEGLVPLDPNYITISSSNVLSGTYSFTLTLSTGWYLYTDPDSKLSFWIWNDTEITQSFTGSAPEIYAGLLTEKKYIGCCQTDEENCDDKDSSLRDGSQSFYQEFTCGAARLQVNITNTTIQTFTIPAPTSPSGFRRVFDIKSNGSDGFNVIYPNGYILQSITGIS